MCFVIIATSSYFAVPSSEVTESGVPGRVERAVLSPRPLSLCVELPGSGEAIPCCFSRSSYDFKRSKSCRSANLRFLGFFTCAAGTHAIRDFTQFEQGVWRSHFTLRCEQSTQGSTLLIGFAQIPAATSGFTGAADIVRACLSTRSVASSRR